MKKFLITKEYRGYREKTDDTKLGPGYLIEGSQNMRSNDGERIAIRGGYTLDGAAATGSEAIESSYEWLTSRGLEIPLRSFGDEIQFRYGGTWIELEDGFTTVDFNFADYYDTTEKQSLLLMVNGEDKIWTWTGGIATFASATVNTITKQGTTSWAEEGFATTGVRRVIIGGTAYTYTGGESTTTLTGVSADASGETVGSVAHQQMRSDLTTPATGVTNDIIEVLDNQVWVGSLTARQIYVSAQNDYTDYTFSTPRVVGEGALLSLDGCPTGFVVQEESMYIAAAKDQWYKSQFVLSSDITSESLQINRLKTTSQEAAISQGAIAKIKNNVVFINNEPTLDTIGRIENIDTAQTKPISDAVKSLFDRLDFTNVHVKYYKNEIFIALPVESLVLEYNLEKGYWESPHTLPIRRLAIIDGELYGHSNAIDETYKLFTGTNDNAGPINAIAKFSYMNFGPRSWEKSFDEWYTEGLIGNNSKITLEMNYEWKGSGGIQEFEIDGNDTDILFTPSVDASLGKVSLGQEPMGSTIEETEDLVKFRQINTTIKQDFFEVQPVFSSNEIDFQWELLAFGPNALLSKAQSINIKK
jgi:hypothetical protein